MDNRLLVLGIISSILGAIVTDLDAYLKNPEEGFKWRLALVRCIRAALLGLATGLGIGVVH